MGDSNLHDLLLANSRIPPRYMGKTLDDLGPDGAPWAAAARRYVDAFDPTRDRPGLFLSSTNDVGVGKTHLACCILKGLIYQGKVRRQVSYYRFSELVESLAAQDFRRTDAEDEDNLRRLQTSEVVLWDDLDKFVATGPAIYRLHRVVDRLWGDATPVLLVTSNCDGNELVTRLGAPIRDELTSRSIISRIAGLTRVWDMTGSGITDFRVENHDRSRR